jgi:uncharacterized protein (TIGR03437 family)
LTALNGAGQALALNQDGSLNTAASPAARGSALTLFVTGEGPAPEFVQAEIAGYAAEVLYAGPAPGYPGLFQMNIRTPGGFSPPGMLPLRVVINGAASQDGVTVASQ